MMLNDKLGESLGKAFSKKTKSKGKKPSTPLKSLAKRFSIPDEDYDEFRIAFQEAVKDSMND